MRWVLVGVLFASFLVAWAQSTDGFSEHLAAKAKKSKVSPNADWGMEVIKKPVPPPPPKCKKKARCAMESMSEPEPAPYEPNPGYNESRTYSHQGLRAHPGDRSIEWNKVYVNAGRGVYFNIGQPAASYDSRADGRSPVFPIADVYANDGDAIYLCGKSSARVQVHDRSLPGVIFDGTIGDIRPCISGPVNCGGPPETWHEYC